MAINSNFSILEPQAWGEVAQELYFPMRPMVKHSVTNVAGNPVAGYVSAKNKTVKVPRMAKTSVSDVETYTGADYTFANPNVANTELTIDTQEGIGFKIDKTDDKFTLIDLVKNSLQPRVESLFDKINTRIKSEADTFEAVFASIGTNAKVMSDDDLREARKILLARKFIDSSKGAIAVLDPLAENDLLSLSLIHQANTSGQDQVFREGSISRLFGFDVMIDNLGSDFTPVTLDAGDRVDGEGAVGDTTIDIDDGAGASPTTSFSAGDYIQLGGTTKDDWYRIASVSAGATEDTLTLSEPLRKTVADNYTPAVVTEAAAGDTSKQYLYDPKAIALVTAGMESVSNNNGAINRAVVFDPTNQVNYTISIQETMQGANVQAETLYGAQNFYPDLGLVFVRGIEAL